MEDMSQISDFRFQISDFKAQSSKLRSQIHKSGFTLVEMLTVIIIISILAGLITAAAVPAIRRAREATIRQDIAQLEMALEKYKQQRGDYPPDFAGVNGGATGDIDITDPIDNQNRLGNLARAAVLRHFRKAFPRFRLIGTPTEQWNQLRLLVQQASTKDATLKLADIDTNPGTDINDLTPGSALAFWLGGPTDTTGSGASKLVGFSANPANPFAIGGSRHNGMYEFDETRLLGTGAGGDIDPADGIVQFIPPHMPQASDGSKAPYVYFRPRNRDYGRTRSDGTFELPFFCQSLAQGICTPYAERPSFDDFDKINRWMEPTKFQIICAGLDGLFGAPITAHSMPVENDDVKFSKAAPDNVRFLSIDAANIAPEEDDNITSFTQGKLADRAEE